MGFYLSKIFAGHVKAINNQNSPLLALPVEIIQYISVAFLPADAAASLALCSRSMLKILGSQTLRSLNHSAIERRRFLKNLEKDLPDWLFCYHCLTFHPVDQNGDPYQLWRFFNERKCVRVNGVVSIGYVYHIRYEYVQLLMRNYRLGRPHEVYLQKLNHGFARHLPNTSLEAAVTARIVAGELFLQVKYTLKLLKSWDAFLILSNIQNFCPHILGFRDSIFAQALRCRLSHADQLPCIECKEQKHCRECSTSFRLGIRTLRQSVTEVQVDIWRCLGSCESPFDPKWRRQADQYLPTVGEERRKWDDSESMGEVFPMPGATDDDLAKWCARIWNHFLLPLLIGPVCLKRSISGFPAPSPRRLAGLDVFALVAISEDNI